jgi:hypothetical protein
MTLFKEFAPTAATAGRGQLSFGDRKGQVRVINRDFEKQFDWPAFDGEVVGMHAVTNHHTPSFRPMMYGSNINFLTNSSNVNHY